MTLDIFSTEKNRSRALSLTGVTVTNLCVERSGDDEKAEVYLLFNLYSPGNVQGRDWAWDHIGATFWAAFEYSQTEMDFSGDEADDHDGDPAYSGENANTMDPSRDAEFASPGTKKNRGAKGSVALQ